MPGLTCLNSLWLGSPVEVVCGHEDDACFCGGHAVQTVEEAAERHPGETLVSRPHLSEMSAVRGGQTERHPGETIVSRPHLSEMSAVRGGQTERHPGETLVSRPHLSETSQPSEGDKLNVTRERLS